MKTASPLKIWLPSYYFIYYAGLASLSPFLALYYESRGLNGSQIGLLTAISPLVGLVAAPLWSGLADATRRHKAIFVFATVGVVTSALAIGLATSMVWLIPAIMSYAFLGAPIMPLVDSSTMVLLEGRKDRYGRVRMWGTLGWAVMAPVTSWLVQYGGLQWSFYAYAGLVAIALLVAIPIPLGQAHVSVPFRSGVRKLFKNRRWMFFLLVVFLMGLASPSISTYLYLYMKHIGATSLIGVALTVSTISEVPMYFFADKLLRRFKARGLFIMALCVYILRLLLYTFIASPGLILGLQLLHGFTSPAIWAAGISYVGETAPKGLETTSQGIFTGVLNGLGSAAGAYIGGVVFQVYGVVAMFQMFAGILFVALLLFVFVEKRIPANVEQCEAQTAM